MCSATNFVEAKKRGHLNERTLAHLFYRMQMKEYLPMSANVSERLVTNITDFL